MGKDSSGKNESRYILSDDERSALRESLAQADRGEFVPDEVVTAFFNKYRAPSQPLMTTTLRPYTTADEDAAIELWRRTWALHYPHIDFNARVDWWRERWRQELVPVADVVMADSDGVIAGFVTVDPKTQYLDQIVVAPEYWGGDIARMLVDEAKRRSPDGLYLLVNKDNARAIAFYSKHGFADDGEDKNPVSGIAVNRMRWKAA